MSISKLRGGKTALGQQQKQQQHQQQRENVENRKSNENSPSNEATSKGNAASNYTNATTTTATGAVANVNISATAVAKYLGSSNFQQEQLQTQQQYQQQQQQYQYQQQQQQQQTYLPQTSLLKIKPFVPSLNTRLRRPIGRSYSTLSSTYLKRTTATTTNGVGVGIGVGVGVGVGLWGQSHGKHSESVIVGAAIDRTTAALPKAVARPVGNFRRTPIKVITHQRSKSTSSSAASSSNRPATAAANGHHTALTAPLATATNAANGGAIVTPQPNGICRIARLPKEQEKLPDRINYDRRGLTAIPIFENESNLRLLSLQHNLINVFHIPKEEAPIAASNCEVAATAEQTQLETRLGSAMQYMATAASATVPNRPLSQNRSNGNFARMPLALSSPTTNILDCQNSGGVGPGSGSGSGIHSPTAPHTPQPSSTVHPLAFAANGPTSQLLKRNNLLQHLNFNAPHALTAQQHQQLAHHHHNHTHHSHYRFAMKKSKSFISNSNSSRQATNANNVRRGASKPLHNKTEAKMLVLLGRTNLKSFDSSASGLTNDSISTLMTSEIEEEDCYENQLEIKNRQLRPSYGIIFQHLVFLDLYDNQIERIANLDGLPTLSVLLLGKNRITDISGLVSLRETLRVLDLHGNKITSISNKINCLQGLKSLNLAGNQIRQINQNDFNGLLSLKELNLKRNRIRRINGFQHLVALERLWLCHNDIHKVDDMSTIAKAHRLLEVTIENNPVSLAGDCVSFLVSYLPNLQSLSQMPITEQVRRAAMAWRKNKELSEANQSQHSADVFNSIRREEVISNARTNWELLRSQQTVQSALKQQRSPKQRELAKISESNETVVGYEELQEYIKLPPIQQQQQEAATADTAAPKTVEPEMERLSGSSNSSLGPNVDSSSSSYSSDNEETPTKQCAETARKKKVQRPASMRSKAAEKLRCLSKESSQNDEFNGHKNKAAVNNNNSSNSTRNDVQPIDGKALSSDLITANNKAATCGNTPPPEATANAQIQNVSASITPSRTPTPVTAMTANSGMLCLGYNNNNNNNNTGKATPTTTAAAATSLLANANSTPITSISIANTTAQTVATAATTATASASTGAGTGTGSGASTCKRYMRGSLMRSHVVVNGSIGGVGGRMKIASRTLAHQQSNATSSPNAPSAASSIISIVTPAGNCVTNTATTGAAVVGIASKPNAVNTNASNLPTMTSTLTTTATATATATAIATATSASPTAATTPNSLNPSQMQAAAPTATAAAASTSTSTSNAPSKPSAAEREREQGGDYLIEICGRYLNIYGQGALRFIDKQWNPAKANDVHTLNFSYINFNNIVAVLARIKVRFPHAENFVFRETNIGCLGQLNALAELQGIVSLFIDPEGNAVTTKDLWRQYAIYRLSHWGLKLLNGAEISATEVDEANIMYAGLSDLVLWSMPDVMLQPLLARLRLDETCTASKMSPKEWLMKPENKSLRLVVGKEALQWKKPSNNATSTSSSSAMSMSMTTLAANPTATAINNLAQQQHLSNNYFIYGQQQQQQQQQQQHHPDDNHNHSHSHNHGHGMAITALTGPHTAALSTRERGKLHFAMMMENTCNAVEKLHKLETLWPSLLLDIVRNTLLDYSQLDAYLRTLMSEIMK